VAFNYVTSVVSWYTDHCCTTPKWKYDKRTYGYSSSEAAGCSIFCNNNCKSSVTCETTPINMELCEWVENFNRTLRINGVPMNDAWASNMTLETSPVASVPYGFWRNETSIFIRADWLYLEGTVFNYSCKPVNPNPKCGSSLRMPEMRTASGFPILWQCSMLIKIPAKIFNFKVEFCESVNLIHNLESDTIGIKSMNKGCMVKIQEGDLIQNLWISEGYYRFFRQLSFIACSPAGNGLYTNCSEGELVLINALDMGCDEAVDVVVEMGSVGSEGFSFDNSGFSNLLGS
jgi:hypothetical protein